MQSVSTAFTQILAKEGIKTIPYIDDIVGVADSKEEAENHLHRATELFKELGLVEA